MLIHIIRLAWVIAVGALVWFGMLIRWVVRNPDWADQLIRHECPVPWFFKVWRVLFVVGASCVGVLIGYYFICFIEWLMG